MNPLEAILRTIAQEAPAPWYPKGFAASQQFDLNQIYLLLEMLHLDGLVVAAPTHPELGPGVVLTPAGQTLLNDPDRLQRLRDGRPLVDGDRGGEVRSVLRTPPRGRWTGRILLANITVFLYACYLAAQTPGLLSVYAFSMPGAGVPNNLVGPLMNLLHQIGGVHPTDILAGEYWRLLACTFAHMGLMHIALNMFALRSVGRSTEQMWGPWRFVLIYLIAAWGGSCVALAYQPVGLVGASGALCGVLAAEGAWFFLNRRYLPRSAFSRFAGGFLITVVLMVLISTYPGISSWGHLGGALFGLVAALLLHVQRYGRKDLRIPALAATLLLPLAGLGVLHHGMATEPRWADAEEQYYRLHVPEPAQANQFLLSLDERYEKELLPVLQRHPTRREPAAIRTGQTFIDREEEKLQAMEAEFSEPGTWHAPAIVRYRAVTAALAHAWLDYLAEARRCLEVGEGWTHQDEQTLGERFQKLDQVGEVWMTELHSWPGWRTWKE